MSQWIFELLIMAQADADEADQCPAYEEASAKNVNFHFLPEMAEKPGGFKDFSYSATTRSPAPPAALAGKRARLVGYASEPCCALELVKQDCTRVYYHDEDKAFSLKEATELGLEAYPNSGPLKPKPSTPRVKQPAFGQQPRFFLMP